MERDDDQRKYVVLVNEEEQYSLWVADHAVPDGWRIVGPSGAKQVCLQYVEEVWTDMRPKSIRNVS